MFNDLSNFSLISQAFAQASEASATSPQSEFSMASFVPLILIFTVIYFLIIRPQSKRMKEHQELLKNLKVGNKVITSSGIVGVVSDIFEKENQVEVEIAQGIKINLLKAHVSEVVNPQVVKTETEKKKKR